MTGPRSMVRPALDGALAAQGRLGAQLQREPDDLRPRPSRRDLRHAGDSTIVRNAEASGYKMSAFINGIIKSAAFQRGRAPVGETRAAEAGSSR